MTTTNDIFKKLVSDAGIPTTEAEITAEWKKINDEHGTLITNDAEISPFWRLVNSIVTKAAQYFVDFIPDVLLPESFTQTAQSTLDMKAWDVGLERKQANKAVGLITFTRPETGDGQVIPAGTRIQSTPINETVYELVTVGDTNFAYDSTTAMASAEAVEAGSAYNLAAGYYSVLADPESLPAGITVNNDQGWLTTPGDDGETNDELRLRCRNQFLAVNQYHTDAVYRTVIASFSGIRTDYIYFQHGAP